MNFFFLPIILNSRSTFSKQLMGKFLIKYYLSISATLAVIGISPSWTFSLQKLFSVCLCQHDCPFMATKPLPVSMQMEGNDVCPNLELMRSCFFLKYFSLLCLVTSSESWLFLHCLVGLSMVSSWIQPIGVWFLSASVIISIKSLFQSYVVITLCRGSVAFYLNLNRQIGMQPQRGHKAMAIILLQSYISLKMSKKAENEVRKRIEASGGPQGLEQLCLDSIEIRNLTPSVKKLLEGCASLEYLTMNDCGLESLEHFPHMPNLIALELTDNKLTGDDLAKLSHSPKISYLMLDSNQIASLSAIRQLTPLAELEILEMTNNQICESENYRQSVFDMLPSLKIVNYYDRDNKFVDQQIESEDYISEIGDSRRELMDFLDEQQEQDEPVANNNRIQSSSNSNLKRSYSVQTAPSPNTVHTNFKANFFPDQFQRQKEIMLMRTDRSYQQSSEDEQEDVIREFKRKMTKKQQ